MAQRYESETISRRGRERSREEWRPESEWRGNRESPRYDPDEDLHPEERYGRHGGDGGFTRGYGYDYETLRDPRERYDAMEQERYRSGYGRPGNAERPGYDPQFSQSRGLGDRLFGASNYRTSPQDFGSGSYGRPSNARGFGQDSMGPFAGRGPKGYKRSDERIQEEINEALTQHPGIDPSELEVKVKDGEVTLSGTVEERRFKRMAEDIAECSSGVRDVHNEIRVQHNGHSNAETHQGSQPNQSHGKSPSGSGSKMPESKTA